MAEVIYAKTTELEALYVDGRKVLEEHPSLCVESVIEELTHKHITESYTVNLTDAMDEMVQELGEFPAEFSALGFKKIKL